jgi:hypothetical protein
MLLMPKKMTSGGSNDDDFAELLPVKLAAAVATIERVRGAAAPPCAGPPRADLPDSPQNDRDAPEREPFKFLYEARAGLEALLAAWPETAALARARVAVTFQLALTFLDSEELTEGEAWLERGLAAMADIPAADPGYTVLRLHHLNRVRASIARMHPMAAPHG